MGYRDLGFQVKALNLFEGGGGCYRTHAKSP